MKKIFALAVVASVLSACGGGSTETESTTPVASSITAGADVPAASAQAGTSTSAPPLAINAVRMTNTAVMNTNNMIFSLSYSATNDKNLTLVGNNNKMWVLEGVGMNTVSITGTGNVIVYMKDATAMSLTVSAGNTVYLPAGTTTRVLGTGVTVVYYNS